jgi:transglutaminase-like putative cysteine protease
MNTAFQHLIFNRSFWLLFFLLFMVMSLAVGLGDGIRGGVTWLLTPITLAGALISYGLAKSRIKGLHAGVIMVIFGISGIIFHIARLSRSFVLLINSLILLRLQIITWFRERLVFPDLTMLVEALTNLANSITALLMRSWVWVEGLWHGDIINDPVARAFIWSLIVFLLSIWAGWMLGRHHNPLVAFTPALAVLAIVSDYTNSGFTSLWMMLAGMLFLMGLSRYDVNRIRWQRTGIDFSDSIPTDTGAAIIIITLGLTVIAWTMPSFSVRAMLETIREHGKSQDEVAESFGLIPAPAPTSYFAPYIAPKGLPRSHLLGSGPELNKLVVMTIRTGEIPPRPMIPDLPPAPRHYWRELTYDRYTGSGWISDSVEVAKYKSNEPVFEVLPEGYKIIQQDVSLYENLGGQIHWTGYLISVDEPFEVAWRSRPVSFIPSDPFAGYDMFGAISQAKSFTATSLEPEFSVDELRASNGSYPPWTKRYLTLPKTTPERVITLARDLTAASKTSFDRALAIESYLRTTFPYTLDIPAPPPGHDVADYFLFELKKGYCDYYATAMVVLARAAGLPARFVTGYANGSYDPASAQYIVTEANAHSWVEIFFPDIGWVEFEPTAGLPAIDRLEQPVFNTLPTLPPNIGKETTKAFIERIAKGVLQKIALGLTIIILVIIAALWAESCWLSLLPANISLAKIYRRMEKQGRHIAGFQSGETPYEFSGRLAAVLDSFFQKGWQSNIVRPAIGEMELIIGNYVGVSFSQHPPSKTTVTKAIRAWRSLQLRLFFADFHEGATGNKRKNRPKK